MAQKKQKSWGELTDYEKFTGVLESFKDFLNPKLLDNFLMITNRYVEGEINKARAQVISPELQQIEALIINYRNGVKTSHPQMSELHLINITKKIKELYGCGL
jgi:hypothetical protein